MSNTKINTIGAACALAVAALFTTSAQAAQNYSNSIFGSAASESSAQKHIDISQGKRAVNVVDGQTVEFTKNGQSFTWHFDTLANAPELSLSAIAPAGFDSGSVKVYVSTNPINNGA